MSLYTIGEEFKALFDSLEEMSDDEDLTEAWFDTLEGIEADFGVKAENLACFIKALNAEAAMIAAEERALAQRRRAKENKALRLKCYLTERMDAVHLKAIDRPKARITIRDSPESVAVEDRFGFIGWAMANSDELLTYKEPEINKQAVRQALKQGKCLPHVHLQKSRTVVIK